MTKASTERPSIVHSAFKLQIAMMAYTLRMCAPRAAKKPNYLKLVEK